MRKRAQTIRSGECYPFFSCEAILDLVVVGEEERGFCLSLSPASLVLRLHPAMVLRATKYAAVYT